MKNCYLPTAARGMESPSGSGADVVAVKRQIIVIE